MRSVCPEIKSFLPLSRPQLKMLPRQWSRSRGCSGRARAWLVCVAAAACALRVRVPLPASDQVAAQPSTAPHKLAEHLADFNNLRKLYPYIESWRIDEQWSNYTSWQYALRFSCGARCSGRARVLAHDAYAAAAPAHGSAALQHSVVFHLAACRTLPLLAWPSFCEELEVEWTLRGDGAGGARVAETARARASAAALALRALAGAPAHAPGAHLRALREAFP